MSIFILYLNFNLLPIQVRFVDSKGKFVGPVMVAKESRFIEGKLFSVQGKLGITYCQSNRQHIVESHMYRDQVKYHKEFMRAQDIASNLAKKYNEALSQVQTHFRDSLHDIPRIEFIEPVSIYCHLFSMLMITNQPQHVTFFSSTASVGN